MNQKARWLVTRHKGAVEWFAAEDFIFDRVVSHIDPLDVSPGDDVFGTLPISLVAELCERNITYWHLELPVPESLRGLELDADKMRALGARVRRFQVKRLED